MTASGRRSLLFPRATLVVLGLSLLGAAACGSSVPLTNTFESPDAVGRAVLRGLAARDVEGLSALAVGEDEFRELVWPKLPTSRPGRNIPWDYAWKDLHSKSRLQLLARSQEWKDRGFELVSVRFQGDTTDYETYRIYRKTVLTLRDRTGQETQARLFGSMIEQNGRYKVFSYVVD
jgi:hypothetical protein